VTVGKLSVDVHLACACICVYVHADLRYALTLLWACGIPDWPGTSSYVAF
jgi:hypothetical protein